MLMLELYCHPLASYCWKVLIALYEHDVPFVAKHVDLADPAQRAALAALWPFAKFPVLHDRARGEVVPESSIIIEYLARHYGMQSLVPDSLDVRLWDRFYDLYVQEPMQRLVGDLLRPADARDPHGVAAAKRTLDTAYAHIERAAPWAISDAFTLADCAASPALYYADQLHPLGEAHLQTRAYLARLIARPAMARVMREAAPYMHAVPGRRS